MKGLACPGQVDGCDAEAGEGRRSRADVGPFCSMLVIWDISFFQGTNVLKISLDLILPGTNNALVGKSPRVCIGDVVVFPSQCSLDSGLPSVSPATVTVFAQTKTTEPGETGKHCDR